jgi:glycosyltransferase involved in cell wall biosynthesis
MQRSVSDSSRVYTPSVSVILIVKNGARYIADALASTGLSEHLPSEILVIDGGSTDGTHEIVKSVPGVTLIGQSSSGIADAYNEGIRRARGELVAFLSADDIWLPGKLDRHCAAFADDPDLLLSVCMVEHFLEDNHAIPTGFRPDLLEKPHPGMIMEALVAKRDVFALIGGFDPTYSTGEDTDWFARARDARVKLAVIPEVLLRKRVHDSNASLTDPDCNRNLLRAMRTSHESAQRVRRNRDAMTRISVLVPCYNDAAFLEEALHSALRQSREPDEIIVVDDGSNDDSLAVAARFGDRVRCKQTRHQGISGARNTCLREARGDIIAFLDADDVWPRTSLETRMAQLEREADADAVFGMTEEFLSPEYHSDTQARRVGHGPVRVRLPGATLVRHRTFDTLGGFNETLAVGEWIDWFDRFNNAGLNLSSAPEIVLRRRIHAGNAVHREPADWRGYLKVLRSNLERKKRAAESER